MDLSDLHIFRTVVQAGGITKAAQKLNRVQSNVTTRVRQLEQDLGVALFIREGKRMQVSPEGQLLLGYADRLLALAQEARDAVHDAKPRGLLRLGSMESTAAIRLPAPLNDYHSRYPEVTLELHTGNTKELSVGVLTGELDAALVAEPIADAPFDKVTIYEEELTIVASARHPPIRAPRDVGPQTIIAFEEGCPYRARLEQWFAQAGELPQRIIDMSSWHAILGCVAAGMGVALLPRMVLNTLPQRTFLSIYPLPPELARSLTVMISRKGTHSPKVAALREVLIAHAAEEDKTEAPKRSRKRATGPARAA